VSDMPGDSVSAVEYSRAGYTLFITSRHEVTIVSDNTEHTGDDRITAINEAIEGLVINKQEGKFLGFHDIPPAAYELAASFCTVYVVDAGKGKIHTCSFKPNGPLVDGALALYFDTKLRPLVMSSQPLYSAPDYVHDYIAYCVWRSAGDRLGTLAALLDKRTLLEADRALNTTDKLVVTNKVRAMEKLQLVMNTLKIAASADSAVAALDKARGSRNRTLVTQFIQKNVGGILAGDLMPSIETVRKAHGIVQFLRSNYPVGFEEGKEWNLYGIAYNHMARALDPVVKGKLRFFDVQKATNSLARFETRSILAAEGCDVLIDDSYADRAIDAVEMTSADIDIVMRFDQAKMVVLSRLVNAGEVGVVVMKVNLSAFTTEYLETTNTILFPDGKAVCRHVRLYKFGKLHNAEVFLVLSNATTMSQNNVKAPREIFKGDIQSISLVMNYINRTIMLADSRGLRLCAPAYVPGPLNKDRKFPPGIKPTHLVTPRSVWTKLLLLMPVNWPWYHVPLQREILFSRVIHTPTGVQMAEGEDTAEFDDPLGDRYLQVDDLSKASASSSDDSIPDSSVSSSGDVGPSSTLFPPAPSPIPPVKPKQNPKRK